MQEYLFQPFKTDVKGTGTDTTQEGRELLKKDQLMKRQYSSLYTEKHLGGKRSAIPKVSIC